MSNNYGSQTSIDWLTWNETKLYPGCLRPLSLSYFYCLRYELISLICVLSRNLFPAVWSIIMTDLPWKWDENIMFALDFSLRWLLPSNFMDHAGIHKHAKIITRPMVWKLWVTILSPQTRRDIASSRRYDTVNIAWQQRCYLVISSKAVNFHFRAGGTKAEVIEHSACVGLPVIS